MMNALTGYETASVIQMMTAKTRIPIMYWPATGSPACAGISAINANAASATNSP